MKIRFSDGTVIDIPAKENATEYLYRNFPQMVSEYAEYLEHFNRNLREVDRISKAVKYHNNSTTN